MPVQEPKKYLSIAILRDNRKVEGKTLEKRKTVSIGRDSANTFTILSSSIPQKWDLLVHDSSSDKYSLCIDKSCMKGRVLVRPKTSEIKIDNTTESQEGVTVEKDTVRIDLTNQSHGRIDIGRNSILFKFEANRDEMIAARLIYEQPSFIERCSEFFPKALVVGLVISLLLHLGPLIFIGVQDWPRQDDMLIIPSWLKPIEIGEMELEEEKTEEDVPPEENGEEVTPEVVQEDKPEDSTATRDELIDQITDKHREEGAAITAQILGMDGGMEGFYADLLDSNAHIADMSDISSGDIGASAGSSLLNSLAMGDGTGSGQGLLGIDGANAGPQVVVANKAEQKVERAKVTFKMETKSDFSAAAPAGSKEAIEGIFKKKQGDIKNCYQRVMNAQGKASGRFVISILVAKDGMVQKVEKIEDQIGGDMFTCVRQRIMNWKFGELKSPIAFKKTWIFN